MPLQNEQAVFTPKMALQTTEISSEIVHRRQPHCSTSGQDYELAGADYTEAFTATDGTKLGGVVLIQ